MTDITDIKIPGPGAAMAIAAGTAAFATALVGKSDISDSTKPYLFFSMLFVTFSFGVFTIIIEFLHIWKDLKTETMKNQLCSLLISISICLVILFCSFVVVVIGILYVS